MKKEKYPFVKCLNPQSIVNPHTNERLLVQCGKCKACRIQKGSIASMKCQLESLSHKYTMFVTLTYSQAAVPLMNVIPSHLENYEIDGKVISYISKSEYDKLVSFTPRVGIGTILGNSDSTKDFVHNLKIKTNTMGLLPHLYKRDIQLFMKRLRKYISQYSDEKIRYYAVGEYGPVHFRPHYHLLLWFSSEEIYKIIRQSISEAWRFGRVDVETSRGQSADYVAKYVNGNCSLPRIYQQKETKPFALHSIRLGEMVLSKSRQEIYSLPVEEVVSRSIPLSNGVTDVNLWRSLKTFYFPRCKKYSLLSESERMYSYLLYDGAKRIFETNNLSEVARNILDDFISFRNLLQRDLKINHDRFKNEMNYFLLDTDSEFVQSDIQDEYQSLLDFGISNYLYGEYGRMIEYFLHSSRVNIYNLDNKDYYHKVFFRIYMELRLSRHFIDFVCESMMSRTYVMYKKIESFWREVDYLNLVHQFEVMETFCENHFSDESDLQMFYGNVPHDMDYYKNSKYYNELNWQTECSYEKSVKHKKLNDMNNIFRDR